MADEVTRLQHARDEIDKTFGVGHAAENSDLVIAVTNAASSDYAAQLIARSLRDIAIALLKDEPVITPTGELLRARPPWTSARIIGPWGSAGGKCAPVWGP
jgi:hypothetical protein